MVNKQPFTAKFSADIPDSVAVGEPSEKFAIHAGTTVDAAFTPKLRFFGVRAVEGTVNAKVGVAAPQGDSHFTVPLSITKTSIPESGSFDVTATGAAPSRTFSRPGNAKITVGDVNLHLVGKKANGEVLGEVDVRCALDAGQNNVVGSFKITGTTNGSTTPGTSTTSGTSDAKASGAAAPGTTPASTPTARRSAPTSFAPRRTATDTTATSGHTRNLILLAVGTLFAASVVAFSLGSRPNSRRRSPRR